MCTSRRRESVIVKDKPRVRMTITIEEEYELDLRFYEEGSTIEDMISCDEYNLSDYPNLVEYLASNWENVTITAKGVVIDG